MNIKIAVLLSNCSAVYCDVVNSAPEIDAESLTWKLLPVYKSSKTAGWAGYVNKHGGGVNELNPFTSPLINMKIRADRFN